MLAAAHRDNLKGQVQHGKAEREDSLQTSDVVVCESLIELLEVSVIDMLKYQSWGSADRILANWFQS